MINKKRNLLFKAIIYYFSIILIFLGLNTNGYAVIYANNNNLPINLNVKPSENLSRIDEVLKGDNTSKNNSKDEKVEEDKEEIISSGTNNEDNKNTNQQGGGTGTKFIKDRVENIKERLGINISTELQKELNNISKNLSDTEIETLILQDLIRKNKIERNKAENLVIENTEYIKKLEADINKIINSKDKSSIELIDKLKSEIKIKEANNKSLKEQLSEYKTNIEILESKLRNLNLYIEELKIYKEKYDSKVFEEKKQQEKENWKIAGYYIGLLVIFAGIIIYLHNLGNKYHQKRKEDNFDIKKLHTIFLIRSIIYIVGIVLFIIQTYHFFPAIGLILLFLSSGLLLALRPIIGSFFAMTHIIATYQIGDIINYNGTIGEIEYLGPLSVRIREFDNNHISLRKRISIPNNLFIEKDIGLIDRDKKLLKREFTVVLKINELKSYGVFLNPEKFNLTQEDLENFSVFKNFIQDIEKMVEPYKEEEKKNKVMFKFNYYCLMKNGTDLEIKILFYYEKNNPAAKTLEKEIYSLVQEKYLKIAEEKVEKEEGGANGDTEEDEEGVVELTPAEIQKLKREKK